MEYFDKNFEQQENMLENIGETIKMLPVLNSENAEQLLVEMRVKLNETKKLMQQVQHNLIEKRKTQKEEEIEYNRLIEISDRIDYIIKNIPQSFKEAKNMNKQFLKSVERARRTPSPSFPGGDSKNLLAVPALVTPVNATGSNVGRRLFKDDIGFVTEEQYNSVPSYMLERIPLVAINNLLKAVFEVFRSKYEIESKKATFSEKQRSKELVDDKRFVTEEDMAMELSKGKTKTLDRKSQKILNILRHLTVLSFVQKRSTKYYFLNV